jgi:hypothetical protein
MTALSGALLTFTQIGQREDLAEKIFNISPTDTPGLNAFDNVKANAVKHEWQTDALAAPGANNQLEGDTFTFSAPAVTTRLDNSCQISYKTVAVSKTASAVNTAGRNREMVYQTMKRSKELKRDMEYVTFNNQTPVPQASANSSTARALRPVLAWYSTNVDAGSGGANGSSSAGRTDGAQRDLTEDMLKNAIRKAWVAGGEPTLGLCGSSNKQKISTFGGNATRYIQAADRLKAAITFYEHDFGVIKFVPDRFSRDRDVHILDENYWAKATLRPMTSGDLAEDSDADKGKVITEWTIESRNEAASALIADLTTAA